MGDTILRRDLPGWVMTSAADEAPLTFTILDQSPTADPPRQVVFIDGALSDASALAAGVVAGAEAVILDPAQDGVAQMAAWLAAHDAAGLESIAIVAHAADGVVMLGTGVLDSATIATYAADLAAIGAALRPGGDILLYGCDVAQDAAGVAFVEQLAAATGADVAAASHIVGNADQGGSFTLDVTTGAVTASNPFTVAAQSSLTTPLPTSVNQLYYTIGNNVPTSKFNSVLQLGVNGTSVVSGPTTLVDGSQATFGNGTTVAFLPGVAVDPAAGKYFVTDSNSNASFNTIYVGDIASPGTLTAILNTPTTTTQLRELALDQPNATLYYALNASTAGSIGIYSVLESGGTATAVINGFTSAAYWFQIALDLPDNLIFFADSIGFFSVSTLWAGNVLSHTATALTTITKGSRLEGVAVANGTVYFSTLNGSTLANNNIFSAPFSVTGSGSSATASLGTVSTLYRGAALGGIQANNLAVDATNGLLYVAGPSTPSGGNQIAAISVGTVTGGGTLTQVTTLVTAGTAVAAAPIMALTFESTPTVSASGTATYLPTGSAVTLAPSAGVTNATGFNLASAKVAITGGTFVGDGDTLTATTAGTGITASFSGETLTLSGNDTLLHYQQVLRSVAFKSTASDPANAGANKTRTVNWTVSDGIITSATPVSTIVVNTPPVVTAGGTATFTGGGSAVSLTPGLTVSDIDDTTLASAFITITGFISGDVLNFTTQNGITGSYAVGTGTLSLAGSASLANYQTALNSITYSYSPSNGDPTGGGTHTSRTINFVANDGLTGSTAATSTLTVVHAAPTVTATGTISYGHGSGPVALDPTATVIAPDSLGNIGSATITLSGSVFGGDGDVLAATTAGTAISASYNSTTEVLTLSGLDTAANYQTVLRSVTINSTTGVDPTQGGTQTTRNVSWVVNDGVAASAPATSVATAVPCFLRGTMLRSEQGEIAVEDLRAGDLVATASGALRPVHWIGRRSYDGRFVGDDIQTLPIRIRAGALGDGAPMRDLRVSPLHALLFAGDHAQAPVLIPAGKLVNGVSITREAGLARIDYFHVELESHDILLAEGAAAESFIDLVGRHMFQNAHEYQGAHDAAQTECAERVVDGARVYAARAEIDGLAGMRPGALQGFVDEASPGRIAGWAQDVAHPDAPVVLVIAAGGMVIAEVMADIYRPDLAEAGIGSGRHAFVFELAMALDASALAGITITRRCDGAAVPGAVLRAMAA